MRPATLLLAFLLSFSVSRAQDDLMTLFDQGEETTDYTYATFKTSRLVLGQSVENPAKGTMLFLIQHHFGYINTGAYEFWGLDQATIRLGLEYGLNDWLAFGVGRSSYKKNYDGFLKAKILRQSSGAVNMPLSISYFGSLALNSLKWSEPDRKNYFSSRLSYTHQLLIARKLSPAISLQITPTIVHKNLVPTNEDKNTIFASGFGGRLKVSNRVSVNAEYFYVLPDQIVSQEYDNSFSLGFDIETGGHVFQLFLTNSNPIFESGFITETNGKWTNGDIYFGFNISRAFTIVKPEGFKE
ncbi:MAG: DUF5777 family beta-barrel protein [Bacteroidales bacterium]|nr:DUF5777 family beta-barrel protein [Bacteroidales bacterium]